MPAVRCCPAGRVLAGAYPASLDDLETQRVLTLLLELGVNTFVCLQAGKIIGKHISVDRPNVIQQTRSCITIVACAYLQSSAITPDDGQGYRHPQHMQPSLRCVHKLQPALPIV
jgi:hypothetical protein